MTLSRGDIQTLFFLWDKLDSREQTYLMSEFKKLHPGGFTREELLSFLERTLLTTREDKKDIT